MAISMLVDHDMTCIGDRRSGRQDSEERCHATLEETTDLGVLSPCGDSTNRGLGVDGHHLQASDESGWWNMGNERVCTA